MLQLTEPVWGVNVLKFLNVWMMSSPHLIYWIPKLADIFVFVYPVYLVILYFRGHRIHLKNGAVALLKHPNDFYKKAALFIVTSTLVTVSVNLFIQLFIGKQRPDVVLGLLDKKTESILHNYLPTSSFPSDHAGLSMAIAMATLLWGIKQKDRRFLWLSIPLFVFSLTMGFCRITAAIHRPTDVIVGSLIGFWIPWILIDTKLYKFLDRFFGWIARIV